MSYSSEEKRRALFEQDMIIVACPDLRVCMVPLKGNRGG